MKETEKSSKGHEIRINGHEARLDVIEHDKSAIGGGIKAIGLLSALVVALSSYFVVSEVKAAKRDVIDSVTAVLSAKGKVP